MSLVEQPSIKESSPLSSDLSEAVSCGLSEEKKGKNENFSGDFICLRIYNTSLTKCLKSPALLYHPSINTDGNYTERTRLSGLCCKETDFPSLAVWL